ncbi:MAG TPA: patatin-like phospholipase family protein [Steroidobacteraceae bacterium]|nr:patatin-like phospholipase family protein [Steroidobacteraceae bacterium]
MLTIGPARRRRTGRGKLAIALAGGGPLGAFYALGALHALEEAIGGRALTDFDVYVGVSSGSLVAAGLANGFDTTTLGTTFIHDESTLLPFSPGALLRPALGEYASRVARIPAVLAGIARQLSRDPLRSGWAEVMGALGELVPAAVFDNQGLEHYLHAAFTTEGHTDDFRRLPGRLHVVATDLNTGESVSFGDRRHDRVPISRALVASAALPGLYPAVEIDGHHYVDGALTRTLDATFALDAGCGLVICINPLVPFDASREPNVKRINLADRGLPAVLGQTFRALIHSRMQIKMASYASSYPRADILLFQPDQHDEEFFFTNVFRYAGRRRLANHAYQRTRRDLLAKAGTLAPLLEQHGLTLDVKRLREADRRFSSAARERSAHVRHVSRRLGRALGRLEGIIAAQQYPG